MINPEVFANQYWTNVKNHKLNEKESEKELIRLFAEASKYYSRLQRPSLERPSKSRQRT